MSEPSPIFIGRTRSFWLGIVPALLVLADLLSTLIADPAMAQPLARALSLITGQSIEAASETLLQLSPFFALLVAVQRGERRAPYSLNPHDKG